MVECYAVKKNEKPLGVMFGKIVITYHVVEELRGKVIASRTTATRP